MSPPEQARQHQQERAELGAATARAVRTVWSGVDPEDLERSWLARAALVAALIRRGQLTAASSSEAWLRGEVGEGEGQVKPEAAVAATGDLTVPLLYPLIVALNRVGRGWSTALSILSGAAFLEMVTRSLIADAGRIADMAGMIARPRVVTYVRVVELPACPRCIILAGAEYSLSEGFLRHPRCDCTMAPRRPGDTWELASPKQLYEQMSPEQQRKAFGRPAARAIGDGADLAQVVNARRGMTTATRYRRTVQATTEGTTRRGLYGSRRAQFEKIPGNRYATATAPRLLPEEIYRQADNRAHAIRLLRRYGYLF
ncbi:hypothetical protein [Streptomyces sp. NPDC051310]|uniref:VG15 protein n=1 Tax=Streptomyces sp. NPDC051310 TaxID=3365649 RepID=UPI00378B246F